MEYPMVNFSAPQPCSLHDAVATALELRENTLILRFSDGFFRCDGSRTPGHVRIDSVDWDFSCAYVLDFCGNAGRFEGEKRSLKDFVMRHASLHFEIVDVTVGYRQTHLSGYLTKGRQMRECRLEISHSSVPVYVTQDPSEDAKQPTETGCRNDC